MVKQLDRIEVRLRPERFDPDFKLIRHRPLDADTGVGT
jgi:hypothetical protein